jgi:hypothetical protein
LSTRRAARLANLLLPDCRLVLPARKLALAFVARDIVAFVVQAVGGVMAGPRADPATAKVGLRVYTGGVSGQLVCIAVFAGLLACMCVRLAVLEQETGVTVALGPVDRAPDSPASDASLHTVPYTAAVPLATARNPRTKPWRPVVAALFAALFLITFRIAFRIAEFARGIEPATNPLPFHEVYSYVFDAPPMMAALAVLALVHPAWVLRGAGSEFPGRKERKEERRVREEEKMRVKEERKKEREERKRGGEVAVEMV